MSFSVHVFFRGIDRVEELLEEASCFIFRTAGLIIFAHYFRNAVRFVLIQMFSSKIVEIQML